MQGHGAKAGTASTSSHFNLASLEGRRVLLEFYRKWNQGRIAALELDVFGPHFLFVSKSMKPLGIFLSLLASGCLSWLLRWYDMVDSIFFFWLCVWKFRLHVFMHCSSLGSQKMVHDPLELKTDSCKLPCVLGSKLSLLSLLQEQKTLKKKAQLPF